MIITNDNNSNKLALHGRVKDRATADTLWQIWGSQLIDQSAVSSIGVYVYSVIEWFILIKIINGTTLWRYGYGIHCRGKISGLGRSLAAERRPERTVPTLWPAHCTIRSISHWWRLCVILLEVRALHGCLSTQLNPISGEGNKYCCGWTGFNGSAHSKMSDRQPARGRPGQEANTAVAVSINQSTYPAPQSQDHTHILHLHCLIWVFPCLPVQLRY
ncbi:hypothetical protein ASPZODRAFT_737670 [Penicilliopsis zonata CBS 506.65]|uniref:Uncharacterized protein n=1 Tax=Penicilliopsis zonata CBS 506.65 TaxID=1073090 RepID=A0A1L9SCA2_9EURO|nr:hypothetical protein ASPZODRAFT_737670 [Penicilliopsis zonata CBS 506.65]OJJ44773.1 hypothetical protein ASPZODRAFT_737670 [Penicilliopsis zonata CBS 506.65]